MLRGSRKDFADQIKEQFLPRTDKYKDIINSKQIPTTNQSLIVIPCLTKTYGFKINQYRLNQKYLRGVISQKQFNVFVRKANSIVEAELINKSSQQNQPFFKLISILLKVSIILSAIALLLLAVIVYSNIDQDVADIILYLSIFLLSSSGLIACLCPIVLQKSSYTSLNYQKIIGEKLKQLQSEQNKFNASRKVKHIIWRIQKNFYWIQLHISRIMLERGVSIEMDV